MRRTVNRASITVLMPAGSPHDPASKAWVHVWRDPRGGLTLGKRFAGHTVVAEVEEWFKFFGTKIQQGRSGVVELWLRQDWSAYDWLGEAWFHAPKGHPQSFLDAKAAYDARKAAAKRKGRPPAKAEARP